MNRTEKAKRNNKRHKRLWVLIVPVVIAHFHPGKAFAAETFNPRFLQDGSGNTVVTDLSVFENSRTQAPGDYRVDIWLNNHFIESRNVTFFNSENKTGDTELVPCFKLSALASYGIRTDAFPDLKESNGCVNLAAIPQASASFNFSNQRLLLSIPQAALKSSARGYVSPEQFDEGINAFLLNYRFAGASNTAVSNRAQNNDSQYLNLRPGLNIGAWRLRNYTTWNRSSTSSGNGKWDSVYTYLQRDIIPLKSQLTLGESTAPSDIFEGVPFRGAQIASDDDMLPESLRGYAPVVRGTARTNAQVIVRQNGYIIYQSYVAPGAFEITDLYATGGSGDLYVTIKEADGSEQNLIVPYASLPVLVREGHLKYSVTSGQYRPYDSAVDKKSFTQATAIYGLPWNITVFGGMQAASNYQSLALGVGKNFGDMGAFSADVINSWATAKDSQKTDGQSLRLRYSKNFYETGTNFAIAGYRYSTRDYYSLPELMDTYRYDQNATLREQARNRTELTLNQNLGEKAGALSVSLLREDYWRTDRRMESLALGYNNSYNGISYGVNYSYNRNSSNLSGERDYSKDQIISFNISVPLDRWLSNTWANYSVTSSKPGNTSHSVGLSGTALADNNLSWNAREGYASQGVGNSGNLDADYSGTYGDVSAGYGYDRDMRRLNYGVEGGLLIHKNGATLSQAFGDTAALVVAPGASGVQITNQTGVKTDFRGYTVVPNMTAYRQSDIVLDTTTLPDDVDLDLATVSVVPTRGAIVRARFAAQVGARGIMTLTYKGQPVPFGAMVVDAAESGKQGSIVGDGGQVYLNGLKPAGNLLVQWGRANDTQCHVRYKLPENKPESGIQVLNGLCQ
ncbi:fimbria/pilus outer membrane usher protein [Pantoea sp. BAV 3049]|uniref:fimbria/pilus outer membrane usher protein n=1 Tax=Pantoea sp. BAV 3049 TaxID=2654188 RepID=UPI00131CBC24|nr:fimbria/pilus outer membrane usher protein [Pantoea sp. BAV 3049]